MVIIVSPTKLDEIGSKKKEIPKEFSTKQGIFNKTDSKPLEFKQEHKYIIFNHVNLGLLQKSYEKILFNFKLFLINSKNRINYIVTYPESSSICYLIKISFKILIVTGLIAEGLVLLVVFLLKKEDNELIIDNQDSEEISIKEKI